MKLIRTGVFETNSSSCHTISVADNATNFEGCPTHLINDDNVIEVYQGEFGWEQETYRAVESKLSYVLIYIRDWSGDNTSKFYDILQNLVKEHCHVDGVKLKEPTQTSWGSNEGYIDHQSVECSDLDFLFKDPKQLKAFIFSPSSYIETDNDNH